jgi:c-di-GMP-related signal transduction protein
MLAALLPVRDHRDRVKSYELTTHPADSAGGASSADDDARATLELLSTLPLPRLTGGHAVHVPVTPTLIRDGALSRFASVDAVFVLATEALDDHDTRRAVERLAATGFRFGLDGFPDGDPLPPPLLGATIALDASRLSPLTLASRVQALLHAGLKPIAHGVDDRAARERVLALGVPFYSGRVLPRGVVHDLEAEAGVKRAVTVLSAFSDGRPPDASFDAFVRNNTRLAAELTHIMRSASMGARLPRTVDNALTFLGRDAVLARVAALVARLIADATGDPELALIALRRARLVDRLAGALQRPPHPRVRVLAGLLTVLDAAFGVPPESVTSLVALSPALADVVCERREPLSELIDLIEAYEYGWWPDVIARCRLLGISPMLMRSAYFDAWRDARDEIGAQNAMHT